MFSVGTLLCVFELLVDLNAMKFIPLAFCPEFFATNRTILELKEQSLHDNIDQSRKKVNRFWAKIEKSGVTSEISSLFVVDLMTVMVLITFFRNQKMSC